MKITDISILCKWETLKNRQCIKYLFAPLYVVKLKHIYFKRKYIFVQKKKKIKTSKLR